jgi:hypothetical protein
MDTDKPFGIPIRCSALSAASVLKDLIRSCFNTESTENTEQRKNHSGKAEGKS